MIRIILNYVLQLLLPTLVYLAWIKYGRKKHDNDDVPPALRKGPLFWCLIAGFALTAAGLATIALISGEPPDSGQYQSPRLEGGKIVPPHFKKD